MKEDYDGFPKGFKRDLKWIYAELRKDLKRIGKKSRKDLEWF